MAIHPAQIPVINQAFAVKDEELAWARTVVQAFAANPEAGTIAVDGKMVDKPHLTLARRLLGMGGAG
jgi:citrate lyase subunit beta/citryl-CoA lyase